MKILDDKNIEVLKDMLSSKDKDNKQLGRQFLQNALDNGEYEEVKEMFLRKMLSSFKIGEMNLSTINEYNSPILYIPKNKYFYRNCGYHRYHYNIKLNNIFTKEEHINLFINYIKDSYFHKSQYPYNPDKQFKITMPGLMKSVGIDEKIIFEYLIKNNIIKIT